MKNTVKSAFFRRSRSILGALCAASSLFLASNLPTAAASVRPTTSGPQHLYVSEPGLHRILRFALSSAGLPAMQPDAIITGLDTPRGLAIGPDGRLYVVDAAAHLLAIYEPSPGSKAVPSHVLSLPYGFGIGAVAVDGDGHVYVGYNRSCVPGLGPCGYADVFGPLPSGNAKPIATYFLGSDQPSRLPTALVVNAAHLFAENNSGHVVVLADAPKKPNIGGYPLFCPAPNTWGTVWGSDTALYLSALTNLSNPPSPSQILIVPNFLHGKIPNCPASYAITSATLPLDNPYGIATSGGLLYVTSVYNPNVKSALVFVFDPTKAGKQTPLAVVDGPASGLQAPYALAVGP